MVVFVVIEHPIINVRGSHPQNHLIGRLESERTELHWVVVRDDA